MAYKMNFRWHTKGTKFDVYIRQWHTKEHLFNSEMCLRPCQRSMMELFGVEVNSFHKGSILDIWHGPRYASVSLIQQYILIQYHLVTTHNCKRVRIFGFSWTFSKKVTLKVSAEQNIFIGFSLTYVFSYMKRIFDSAYSWENTDQSSLV